MVNQLAHSMDGVISGPTGLWESAQLLVQFWLLRDLFLTLFLLFSACLENIIIFFINGWNYNVTQMNSKYVGISVEDWVRRT